MGMLRSRGCSVCDMPIAYRSHPMFDGKRFLFAFTLRKGETLYVHVHRFKMDIFSLTPAGTKKGLR